MDRALGAGEAINTAMRSPTRQKPKQADPPWWDNWRHIAAYTYLMICIFDFMGMPIFYEIANPRTSTSELVAIVKPIEPASQVQALQILHEERSWEPLTLSEGGLFHMAFGAILGAAAFTRGQEKTARARHRDEF